MKRSIIILVLLLLGSQFIIAQSETPVPLLFRNNQYYTESLRQANLARLAFDNGDYDESIKYSEESIRYANLSDQYVRYRLRMWETDKAITAAANRLDYASSINAMSRFPIEYNSARAAYTEARSYRAAENWDEAIAAANRVLAILAYLDVTPGLLAGNGDSESALPSQYTVRDWESYKDCLWNIAGRPWVYDNPWLWTRLYEANKSKLPQINNPDLIEPGMILDIPSIMGETRRGMWDIQNTYPPLQ